MHRFTLCDEKYKGISIHRDAFIENGKLHIDGQDLGASVAKILGEDEYEYFYLFSEEMTGYLHSSLKIDSGTNDDLLPLLVKYFSGKEGDSKLREYCEKHNVKYEFHNYY